MTSSVHTEGFSAVGARLLLATAFLSVAPLLAGCGGSSSPTVAHVYSTKGGTPTNSENGGSAPESTASPERQALAYSRCMRSNGVPNFPDPGPGGGFRVGGAINR